MKKFTIIWHTECEATYEVVADSYDKAVEKIKNGEAARDFIEEVIVDDYYDLEHEEDITNEEEV